MPEKKTDVIRGGKVLGSLVQGEDGKVNFVEGEKIITESLTPPCDAKAILLTEEKKPMSINEIDKNILKDVFKKLELVTVMNLTFYQEQKEYDWDKWVGGAEYRNPNFKFENEVLVFNVGIMQISINLNDVFDKFYFWANNNENGYMGLDKTRREFSVDFRKKIAPDSGLKVCVSMQCIFKVAEEKK